MNISEQLARICKKSGADIKEVQAAYDEAIVNIPPGPLQEDKTLKAVNKVFGGGKSPAVSFEAVIFNIGSMFDYSKNKIAAALKSYDDDPESAIQNNIVRLDENNDPVPLDTIEVFSTGTKNNNFGKELKHSFTRKCSILIKQDGTFIPSTLELRNKLATDSLPPINCLLKFRALGDAKAGLRTSDAATSYETIEVISNDKIVDLIMEHQGDKVKILGDCLDYHKSLPEKTPEFYNRLVITSGTVVYTKISEDPEKNHFMILDDYSVEDAVSCFVSNHVVLPERGTDVTIIGQTVLGKKWDTEKKVQTDEEALQLNVSGLISS